MLTRLTQVPVGQAVIASSARAELQCDLHRKGQPASLKNAMAWVLLHMDVLPWDAAVAPCCSAFCSTLETQGVNRGELDMMVAAHAVTVVAAWVGRDKAFAQVPEPLGLETW